MPGRGSSEFTNEFDGQITRCQQHARRHNPRFRFLACTADGIGGFSSHLVTPNSPKLKTRSQLADIRVSADLDEKRVPLELDSDNPGNVTTQNRTLGLVEFDTNSDSEKPYFSKTLGKYLAHLKIIKRPKIKNSELLAGVDQVSRSIKGYIKLAETALSSSAPQQTQKH